MSILFPSLLILCLLGVLAVLGIAYALRGRVSSAGGVLAFTRVIAWIGLILISGSALIGIVTALANGEMNVQVPVEPYWPQYPSVISVTPDHAGSVHSEITTVSVTATNLSFATRGLLAAGMLVSGLAAVAVLAAVITLCNKLISAKPFSGSLLRMGRLSAGALAFGTLLGQTLTGVGTYRVGEEALRVDGYASVGEQEFPGSSPWPEPTFSINYEFGPLFMALAILVVVELVNAGMRLARQNERLKHDTDGLV